MDMAPTGVVFAEEPETSATSSAVQLQQQSVTMATPMTGRQHSEVTTSPAVQLQQQSVTKATPTTGRQHLEVTTSPAVQLQQQSVTTATPTTGRQHSEVTTSPAVQLQQQSVTTLTPTTGRQHSEITTSPAVQLPQQSVTTATPMTEPQQQAPTSAGLAQVLHQLTKISRQLDNFSNQFADVKQRMVAMEKLFHERLESSSDGTVAEVLAPAVGGEQLNDEERCILRRNPLVTNDQQWEELEATLVDSGRHGAFFRALVRTITERIIDRSDAHKTANATLRALVAESYLAERVTMAGYKKCKILQYCGLCYVPDCDVFPI